MSGKFGVFMDSYREARKGPLNGRIWVALALQDAEGRTLWERNEESRDYHLVHSPVGDGRSAWDEAVNLVKRRLGYEHGLSLTLCHIFFTTETCRHIFVFTSSPLSETWLLDPPLYMLARSEWSKAPLAPEHESIYEYCLGGRNVSQVSIIHLRQ